MEKMIGLDEALAVIARTPPSGRTGAAPLRDALGRVLARRVVSSIDSPPFDKSAMDGFAVARGDDSATWTILETVAAGSLPARGVGKGECARIMTGAMLPAGTDRVIRKEYVEARGGTARLLRPEQGDNVVRRGANLRRGDVVLPPKVLAAQDIGILAACGEATVVLAEPPTVGVLCTGGEIRAPGELLGPGEIYDSNGAQLEAQLLAMRCAGRRLGSVADEPAALARTVSAAMGSCELLLLTGGVSEGDYDYVPRCLEDLGAEILFHGVAVKPGKPSLLARHRGGWVFGLPGNPVSTFVIFEVMVRPFLYRRMGIDWTPTFCRGALAEAVKRRSVERTEFLPVRVSGGTVSLVPFHGSAHLDALGAANGLIRVERGVGSVERGAEVDVRLL
jgi:molybdopterin molybdotransferase